MGGIDIIGVLLTVVGFLIVYILNGIKGEISEVKTTVTNLKDDLHQSVKDVDRRVDEIKLDVTELKTRCDLRHAS